MNAADTEAVIVGRGVNALGLLRALSSDHIFCRFVGRDPSDSALCSRFARGSAIKIQPQDLQPERLARALGLTGEDRPVLFLTEELDVKACLKAVDAWDEFFITNFFTPSHATDLLDKGRFHQLALEVGSPVPRSWHIRRLADADELSDEAFPVIVKPVRRDERYTMRFPRAQRLEDMRRLREVLPSLLEPGVELIVQRWIEGEDTDIYFNLVFIDAEGRLRAGFAGRKILCWPPGLGGTAACIAAPDEHDTLTALTSMFATRTGFRGLLGLEYKWDRQNARFVMIEPTVYRTDYQHEVAVINGYNFPAIVFRASTSAEEPCEMVPNYGDYRVWCDFPAARYASRVGTGKAFMQDRPRVDSWMRWRDPLPGLLHYWRFIHQVVRDRFKSRCYSSKLRRRGDK